MKSSAVIYLGSSNKYRGCLIPKPLFTTIKTNTIGSQLTFKLKEQSIRTPATQDYVLNFGLLYDTQGFPGSSVVKNSPANAGDMGSIPGLGRSPWRRKWQPPPVFLPGKSRGQRRQVGYSPWGHQELDTNEQQRNCDTSVLWLISRSNMPLQV